MGLPDRKILMDVSAWAGNVSTSVLIIFINKILMSRTGYGFQYGESLICCSVSCCQYTLDLHISRLAPLNIELADFLFSKLASFVEQAAAHAVYYLNYLNTCLQHLQSMPTLQCVACSNHSLCFSLYCLHSQHLADASAGWCQVCETALQW